MLNTTYKEYTEDSSDVTILDPRIIVFHNVVSDCKGYIDFYETNMPWDGWFRFGSQVKVEAIMHSPLIKNTSEFPTVEEWHSSVVEAHLPDGTYDPYKQELAMSLYSASKFYVDYTKHTQPSWILRPWTLAKYTPDVDFVKHDELTMHYHTDYVLKDCESPGEKFAVTAVFYPNDDYGAGEISFRLIGEEGVLKQIDYKPKAGDIVMFPSDHPYYHGVKRITGSPKYIARMYWQYDYEGSDDWHELNAKYGSEKFAELEDQRIKNHSLMIATPYLRPAFSIKEYYSFLDSGQLDEELLKRQTEAKSNE
jgi:signal peptidase I